MSLISVHKTVWYLDGHGRFTVPSGSDRQDIEDRIIKAIGIEGKYPKGVRTSPEDIKHEIRINRRSGAFLNNSFVEYTIKVFFVFSDRQHFNLFKIMYPEDAKQMKEWVRD